MNRRTLAGDLAATRTAAHYVLALLWAWSKDWVDGALTLTAATLFVLTPTAILAYALFR